MCVCVCSDLPRLLRRVQSRETADRRLHRMPQPDLEQPRSTLVSLRHRSLQPVPDRAELRETAERSQSPSLEGPSPSAAAATACALGELRTEGGRSSRDDLSQPRGEERPTGSVPYHLDQLAGSAQKPRPQPAGGPTHGRGSRAED